MGAGSSKHSRKVAPTPQATTRRKKNNENTANIANAQDKMASAAGHEIRELNAEISALDNDPTAFLTNSYSRKLSMLTQKRERTAKRYARTLPLTSNQRKEGIRGIDIIQTYTAAPNVNNRTRNRFITVMRNYRTTAGRNSRKK